MTLLTICQNVAREVAVEVPTTIFGSNNQTASLLLGCAQTAGKMLHTRYNWLSLVTEYTFATVASTQDYALPSDYSRIYDDTQWDRSNYRSLTGPLSPISWQAYESSVLASSSPVWKRYRIRNVSGTVKFSLFPTPDAVETVAYEYISANWCESSGGTGQSAWAADDDVGVLDEFLLELGVKWRMLSRLGLAYEEERVEYDQEVNKAIARDGGAPVLNISQNDTYPLYSRHNIPDTGFGV